MKKKKKSGISRRAFLTIAGGSGAAFLLKPQEKFVHKLIPYVHAPDYPKPGEWTYYTTTCRECPAGCGLLMWHRDGRVTKAEGNPANPINKGKICIRGQSSVMGQYDENRIKTPLYRNNDNELQRISWEASLNSIKEILSGAEKIMLLSNLQTGSLAGVLEEFGKMYDAPPLYYEAFNYEAMRKANQQTYGQSIVPHYDLQGRDLIVSFGADFLETWISPVEYARDFGDFHSLRNNRIGKFIYFGSAQTMTAVNSDEFVLVEPGKEADIISALSAMLQSNGRISGGNTSSETISELDSEMLERLQNIADEISAAQSPIILAGRPGDADQNAVRAIIAANRLNESLGSNTDLSSPHALSKTAYRKEIKEFFESINENTVLIIHDSNPVYSEPAVKDQLMKAGKIIYIGNKSNETSAMSHWILPSHYPLEDWGDFESRRGSISLMQPVMQPLFDSKSAGDILLNMMGEENRNYREIVQSNWRKWATASNNTLTETKDIEIPEAPVGDADVKQIQRNAFVQLQTSDVEYSKENKYTTEVNEVNGDRAYHLQILPSHFFYDGKLSNRGWLQEISHPVSNIVWQSWIDMNTEEAKATGIEEGDILTVSTASGRIEVPVRLTEKIQRKTLAIDAGRGHELFGKIANGVGVNAFGLASPGAGNSVLKADIEKTGSKLELLYLNHTKEQHERELLRHEELEKIQNDTAKKDEINWPMPYGYEKSKDIYKGHEHKDHRWGMVIDLQKCIGCKACEAACYAENNIPVVGKEHAREGREMSWLKVVPYHIKGGQTAYLPVPCQHCDTAPCEPVCPVYASHHTEEGLNAQIYNRCIGTRYCSNNCPYKVRRFNWSNFDHPFPENLQLNPEVTVRERGVMEKCTFCVQRIRNHEYKAKKEKRELKDGEIVTACMQTCPTEAIYFGDLMDENAQVREMIEDDRKYQLLHELNTKTAVIYLKKVTQKSTEGG